MFNPLSGIPTIAWLVVAVVMVVLVIGWIILPFIMMNTNAYLRRVLREQERTNALLEAMRPPRRGETSDMPSVRVDPRDK